MNPCSMVFDNSPFFPGPGDKERPLTRLLPNTLKFHGFQISTVRILGREMLAPQPNIRCSNQLVGFLYGVHTRPSHVYSDQK